MRGAVRRFYFIIHTIFICLIFEASASNFFQKSFFFFYFFLRNEGYLCAAELFPFFRSFYYDYYYLLADIFAVRRRYQPVLLWYLPRNMRSTTKSSNFFCT